MQTLEFDLSVGDSIRVGNRIVTLIDLEGNEAAFRIDEVPHDHDGQDEPAGGPPAK